MHRTSTSELRASCHRVEGRFKGTRGHTCTGEDPVAGYRPRCSAARKFWLQTRPRVTDPLAVVSAGNGRSTDRPVHPSDASLGPSPAIIPTVTCVSARSTRARNISSLPVSPPSRVAAASHEKNMLPLRRKTIRTWTRYGMHRCAIEIPRDRAAIRMRDVNRRTVREKEREWRRGEEERFPRSLLWL